MPVTSSGPSADSARPASALPLLCLLAVFVVNCLLFLPFTCDDAYITLRYAQNAAAGLGPVFNPGERVEGYSSPLWLVLLTVAARLRIDLEIAAKVLGVLAGIAALLIARGITRRLAGERSPLTDLGLLPLVTSDALAVYAVSGMETILYACLLAALVYCWLRLDGPAWWMLVASALAAALTRPEGALVLALLIMWWGVRSAEVPSRLRRHYWLSVSILVLVLAGLLLARHAYYGEWLPNTFYAKPPGAFGADSSFSSLTYARDYLLVGGAWLWLAMLVGLLPTARWRSAALAALLIVTAQLALVLHARGDWMALSRLLVPLTPLLTAMGYGTLLRTSLPRFIIAAVLAIIALSNVIQIGQAWQQFRDGVYPFNVMSGRPQEAAGRWLRQHFPPQTLVASKRIGGIAYFSGMRTVDALGLVDRRIAMIRYSSPQRGEAEQEAMATEVFRRRPDLILLAVMKRWEEIPLNVAAPDVGHNLRDVDRAIYRGLETEGYRFIYRLPQGGEGELAVYARAGLQVGTLSPSLD